MDRQGTVKWRIVPLMLAALVLLGSCPGLAWAVELEILGDMTSPHGGFGAYQNLLKDSEKLDDTAVWTATNTVTPVADQTPTAPDGSTTADKLTFGGAGTVDSLAQDSGVVSTAAAYTFSVWLRSVSGGTTVVLKIADTDENNTTVVTSLSSTTWERYSVTRTFTSAGGNVIVTLLENAAADAPVVLAWGAQLEKSSKADVYVRTIGTAVSTQGFGLALGKDLHVGGTMDVVSSLTSGADGQDGQFKLYSEQGATDYSVVMNPNAAMTQNVTYTLPADDGNSGQVLRTDGTGALTWVDPTALGTSFSGLTTGINTGAAMTVDTGASLTFSGTGTVNANRYNGSAVIATTDLNAAVVLDSDIGTGVVVTGGTVNFAPSEVAGSQTWGDGSTDTIVWTFNRLSVSDPAITFGGGHVNITTGDLLVNTNKFTVASATGNTVIAGTLDAQGALSNTTASNGGAVQVSDAFTVTGAAVLDGGLTMDTNKFTVADTTGNTAIGGTLGVTGDVAVNTNKFNVTATSGNTAIAGTLSAGATSVAGDMSVRSGDKAVMDSTDAGGTANDTYVVHDGTNDRLRLFVDGVEVARFKK